MRSKIIYTEIIKAALSSMEIIRSDDAATSVTPCLSDQTCYYMTAPVQLRDKPRENIVLKANLIVLASTQK